MEVGNTSWLGDAHMVEGVGPVLAAERTEGGVVLVQHDLRRVARGIVRPFVLRGHLPQRLRMAEAGIEGGCRLVRTKLVQPMRQLHDVGIGVVDDPVFDVGHRVPPRSSARNSCERV